MIANDESRVEVVARDGAFERVLPPPRAMPARSRRQ